MRILSDLLPGKGIGPGSDDWVDPSHAGRLPTTGGAYILAIRLNSALRLPVARLGNPDLPAGDYIYAGSAYGPGGINARVARHFRKGKIIHWHIDHVTAAASDISALAAPGRGECELVSALTGRNNFRSVVNGFGSSDCRCCSSHLLVRL